MVEIGRNSGNPCIFLCHCCGKLCTHCIIMCLHTVFIAFPIAYYFATSFHFQIIDVSCFIEISIPSHRRSVKIPRGRGVAKSICFKRKVQSKIGMEGQGCKPKNLLWFGRRGGGGYFLEPHIVISFFRMTLGASYFMTGANVCL